MSNIGSENSTTVFAAIKFIEQLYIDGDIPKCVFQSILLNYSDKLSIADFNKFSDVEKGGYTNCMD